VEQYPPRIKAIIFFSGIRVLTYSNFQVKKLPHHHPKTAETGIVTDPFLGDTRIMWNRATLIPLLERTMV